MIFWLAIFITNLLFELMSDFHPLIFQLHFHLSIRRLILRPWTLTTESDPCMVQLKQHAKHLHVGQRCLRWKVIVRIRTDIHTTDWLLCLDQYRSSRWPRRYAHVPTSHSRQLSPEVHEVNRRIDWQEQGNLCQSLRSSSAHVHCAR